MTNWFREKYPRRVRYVGKHSIIRQGAELICSGYDTRDGELKLKIHLSPTGASTPFASPAEEWENIPDRQHSPAPEWIV